LSDWEKNVKGLKRREEGNLVFEHVKEGGLAGIIETEEENLGFFLP